MRKPAQVVSQDDINRVIRHMMMWHRGFEMAAPRQAIAVRLKMRDRDFRRVCAEIPEIITSSRMGYWILPLNDPSGQEARMARMVINGEGRSRMIKLYQRQRAQRKMVMQLEAKNKQLCFA